MKIAIASDHGGFELKEFLKEKLLEWGYAVEDFGCSSTNSVDYPDYGQKAALAVSMKKADKGIAICTTGIGMSMVANKYKDVRAALCSEPFSAEMSRRHNDANILVLGSRVTGEALAMDILETWLETPFDGGRHKARLDKFSRLGNSAADE